MVTIGTTSRTTEGFAPELLAVALFEGETRRTSAKTPPGWYRSGDFSGKAGETALLYGQQGPAPRLLLVGLGERDHATPEKLRRAAATVARRARTLKLRDAALSLPTLPDTGTREAARAAAEGARLGLYRFLRHKTTADGHELEPFWLVADEEELDEAREGADIGAKVAAGAVLARDLANEPSNVATPEYLAERARSIAEKYGMQCRRSRPRRDRGRRADGPRDRRQVGLERAALHRAGAPQGGRRGTRRPRREGRHLRLWGNIHQADGRAWRT